MVNSADFGSVSLHRRRQAGAQRHVVTLAVLEPLDAKLLVLGRERRLVHARDGDERREIGALARQFFGELEAGARRNRVGIDRVVEHAGNRARSRSCSYWPRRLGDLAELEREPHAHRAPARHILAVGERAAEEREAVGFLAAVLRALIGDVGGGRGAIEQQRALAVVARPDLQHWAGKPQPVRAVVRARWRRSGRAPACRCGSPSSGRRHRRRGAIAPAGLRHRAGIALDLRLELDRRLVELLALECLVGGKRRESRKGEERGGKAGADARKHD